MNKQNKLLIEKFYNDVINKGDTKIQRQIMSENFIDYNSSPEFRQGIDGFNQFLKMVGSAFPDINVKVEDIISENDKVAVRLTITGTHNGLLMGTIPPGGKRAVWTGIDILKIVDGKITERWSQRDLLGMLRQVEQKDS
jgi:steroid delta-isomerase-like uncharacterized protein